MTTTHAVFTVTQVDSGRWVAKCACCWQTGRRRTAHIAREALDAHIAAAAARPMEGTG